MASQPTINAMAQNPLLRLYMNTTVSMVATDAATIPDLTGRQLSVFLITYLETPPDNGGHTVRGLAAKLNVSKPAITRALDRLTEFGLVRREQDKLDKRSVQVMRTPGGTALLRTIYKTLTSAQIALDTAA